MIDKNTAISTLYGQGTSNYDEFFHHESVPRPLFYTLPIHLLFLEIFAFESIYRSQPQRDFLGGRAKDRMRGNTYQSVKAMNRLPGPPFSSPSPICT